MPRHQVEFKALQGEFRDATDELVAAVEELRDYARGIHPALLTERGLGPALKALARRSSVPVDLDMQLDARLPLAAETGTYYIVSEALTNTARHANASGVVVVVAAIDGVLRVSIRDDGSVRWLAMGRSPRPPDPGLTRAARHLTGRADTTSTLPLAASQADLAGQRSLSHAERAIRPSLPAASVDPSIAARAMGIEASRVLSAVVTRSWSCTVDTVTRNGRSAAAVTSATNRSLLRAIPMVPPSGGFKGFKSAWPCPDEASRLASAPAPC
jgi:hypothetical protein